MSLEPTLHPGQFACRDAAVLQRLEVFRQLPDAASWHTTPPPRRGGLLELAERAGALLRRRPEPAVVLGEAALEGGAQAGPGALDDVLEPIAVSVRCEVRDDRRHIFGPEETLGKDAAAGRLL
jgi:hypothetical protein